MFLYRNSTTVDAIASWASAEIFAGGGNVDTLLILFRLLTMQCE